MNFSNDKYNYQLTDHLGNVRAVISKLKFMETATMEPENLWLEQDAFANVAETAWGSEGPLDHTTPEPTGYVSYLNGAQGQLVGPVKSLRVTQGDRVEMEVFANYYEATSTGNLVGSMAGLLTGPLNLAPTGENTQILSAIDNALTGAALVPGNGDNTPKAYLQYLFVDDNFEYAQPAGVTPYVKMTNAAQVQFNPGVVAAHEKLSLAFEVPEDGYMYIYVATESAEDIDIFFDDFTVKHLGVDIIQRTDYYPFGSVLTHWDKELEDYRFGYQGEFSEEDKETGWNQFEARMWDPALGRWLSSDPIRQYSSPYIGMGNNPIYRIDADGKYSWPWKTSVIYTSVGFGIGVGPLLGAATYTAMGTSYDSHGEIVFNVRAEWSNANYEPVQNSSDWFFGVDGGIEWGGYVDWKNRDFLKSMTDLSLQVDYLLFDLVFGEGRFGGAVGLSPGFSASSISPDDLFYFAYTNEEVEKALGRSGLGDISNFGTYSMDGKEFFKFIDPKTNNEARTNIRIYRTDLGYETQGYRDRKTGG